MREIRVRKKKSRTSLGPESQWSRLDCGVVGMSDRCLPRTVGSWEGRVDGVESILKQGVRHNGSVTIRRDDVDALQRDNLKRWDDISSPIPVS